MKIIRSVFLKTFSVSLSWVKNQQFWERIFLISLRRMNYGNGGDFKQSGELFVANYIQKKLRAESNITIFDVGANHGNYSKELAKVFPKNASIYAFEPSKKTYDILTATTKDLNSVVLNNFGFSDKTQNLQLYTNTEGSGLASVYQRNLDHFGIQMDKFEEIKLSTIDNYCSENKIDHIHFLKLDVEGHELCALRGAKSMIEAGKIEYIQFEFGGCNIDSRTYFQDFYYLLKEYYQLYRILENGLFELIGYKETSEIFITVNYLAIKK